MNSVFWLVANKRDDFIKCQPEGTQLTKHSWNDIQEWMQKSTRLVTAEAREWEGRERERDRPSSCRAFLLYLCQFSLGNKVRTDRVDLSFGREHSWSRVRLILGHSSCTFGGTSRTAPKLSKCATNRKQFSALFSEERLVLIFAIRRSENLALTQFCLFVVPVADVPSTVSTMAKGQVQRCH